MAEKNNNYILIGMPGSGKSTIGVLLAKALGYDFVDTDLVIQQKGGGLLKEIIARIGNDGFKQLEEDVNASIDVNKSVIAPGGSAVYSDKAMRHFKEIGTIIYLKLDFLFFHLFLYMNQSNYTSLSKILNRLRNHFYHNQTHCYKF